MPATASKPLFDAALRATLLLGAIVVGHVLAGNGRALSVTKCVGADGNVAFQATPCASGQRQTDIVLAPPPPAGPSPVYALDPPVQAGGKPSRRSVARKPSMSWECRAADGQVFYRHKRCPGSVPTDGHGESRRGLPFAHRGNRIRVNVTGRPLLRKEACRHIHSGGSTARRGHGFDDQVSSYDRNMGRDPCK